ncbi:MAG: hypothetical protein H0W15_03725 [Gemmatimonadales bacterium]|nr:hypothetical protein [Gemmatimonadales bacterium]
MTLKQRVSQALAPVGADRFQRSDGDIVQFRRKGAGATDFVLRHGESSQRFVAVRPANVDAAALSGYVGTYYSADLDTRITVVRQGDTLAMRQPFGVEWVLRSSFADGFNTRLRGTTTFVFERAADSQVIGFSAWVYGARNILFVKEK